MLSEYKGASNSSEMFQHLVGEEIQGMFQDGPHLVFVLSSGVGLVLTSLGGETTPSFSKENQKELQSRITRRKEEIARKIKELERITVIPSRSS